MEDLLESELIAIEDINFYILIYQRNETKKTIFWVCRILVEKTFLTTEARRH
jgi:hypothetical protein